MRMDEKGVSPVIGVILMVAITVILAAVIASFVFGLGTTVKRAPTISITSLEADSTAGEIYALVLGPEAINLDPSDFSAVVYVGASATTGTIGIHVNADGDTYIDAGEMIKITGVTFGPGDRLRVIITHVPSGQVLLDAYVYAK